MSENLYYRVTHDCEYVPFQIVTPNSETKDSMHTNRLAAPVEHAGEKRVYWSTKLGARYNFQQHQEKRTNNNRKETSSTSSVDKQESLSADTPLPTNNNICCTLADSRSLIAFVPPGRSSPFKKCAEFRASFKLAPQIDSSHLQAVELALATVKRAKATNEASCNEYGPEKLTNLFSLILRWRRLLKRGIPGYLHGVGPNGKWKCRNSSCGNDQNRVENDGGSITPRPPTPREAIKLLRTPAPAVKEDEGRKQKREGKLDGVKTPSPCWDEQRASDDLSQRTEISETEITVRTPFVVR